MTNHIFGIRNMARTRPLMPPTPAPTYCSCRFPLTPPSGAETFSVDWYVEHKAHHLAEFAAIADRPHLVSRLDDLVREAKRKAVGCGNPRLAMIEDGHSLTYEGDIVVKVICDQHGIVGSMNWTRDPEQQDRLYAGAKETYWAHVLRLWEARG